MPKVVKVAVGKALCAPILSAMRENMMTERSMRKTESRM